MEVSCKLFAPESYDSAPDDRSMKARTSNLVRLGHSAVHGKGVFARGAIRKGARIIEYTGERILWEKAQRLAPHDPTNPYHTFFFALDDGMVINAGRSGNESRWINHSCEPNCEPRDYRGGTYIYALRNLKKGEELFYDYNLEPAGRRTKKLERLFACHCGAAHCRGTMLEPLD